MPKDILSQIQLNMPRFSKGQKRIAGFIIDHYDKAAFMTASRLGATVGVSESTVVRFATEVGFEGYPQLQRNLQEIIRNRLTTVQRMEIGEDRMGGADILTRVLSADCEKIRHTMEELDRDSFETAVNHIIGAQDIYILGVRSSTVLANFMAFYFNQIFTHVRCVSSNSSSETFEQMMHIGPGDVFVGFSFPRYSKRTLRAARFARDQGATVISITDSQISPLAQIGQVVLLARSEMASFVDSMVAPLSLVNAIIVAVGQKKKEEVSKTYSMLEGVWAEYDVYEKSQEAAPT